MKTTNILIAIALAVVLAFSGCGSSSNTIKLNEVTLSQYKKLHSVMASQQAAVIVQALGNGHYITFSKQLKSIGDINQTDSVSFLLMTKSSFR